MIRNFIISSIRNLFKNRVFTTISIIGLSLGITCFLLIMSYVFYEYSYDHFQTDPDDIYRIESLFYKGENVTDNCLDKLY